MTTTKRFLLTDNGSLRPEATHSLRRIASELSGFTGCSFEPVSLLHSNKIEPAELGGVPAKTVEPFLRANFGSGCDEFVIVPLFFGPSAAAYEFLPQRVREIKSDLGWPELCVRIAPCLVDVTDRGETRLVEIVADLIRQQIANHSLSRPAVALCDHGAPRIGVTDVRNFIAELVAEKLGDSVSTVRPCSMERRPGAEYDFNEPLLETLLHEPEFASQVVVSMLFFQPGRHAGSGGDVATICAESEKQVAGQQAYLTDLVGSHPDLVPILADRLEQALSTPPVS